MLPEIQTYVDPQELVQHKLCLELDQTLQILRNQHK